MVSEKSNSILKKRLSSLKRRILKKKSKEEEDSDKFPLIISPDGVKYGGPIKDNKIPWRLRTEFSKLISESGHDDASQKVHDRVLREVAANPILARVVPQNSNKWSLLMTLLCVNGLDTDLITPALKLIIESNPAALLWQIEESEILPRPIHIIARFEAYSALMPWIATHYSWILDHPVLKDFPPSFELVRNYRTGGCSAELVREFFGKYPQGLSQIDDKGRLPLQQLLCGGRGSRDDADYADLFRWMAKQNPSSVHHQDNLKWTPLHYVCVKMYSESHSYANNAMLKIAKYLIKNSPKSIFVEDTLGGLPIHVLVAKYDLSGYLEVPVIGALLRMYPDCYDKPGYDNLAPSSVPFLEDLIPLFDEADDLFDDLSIHEGIQDNLAEAIGDKPASLPVDIFLSWTKFRIEESNEVVVETYEEIEEVYREYGARPL